VDIPHFLSLHKLNEASHTSYGWIQRVTVPFSTGFHRNNSQSCDERPLLRMQKAQT
jgi:hypothetical protein